jgi:hypothetical protein
MKICSFNGSLPASSNGPVARCSRSQYTGSRVLWRKQRPRHRVVSYHCLPAPVRRAPQAQPDLLRITRIEFGDDLEPVTR